MEEQEVMMRVGLCKLRALSELIETYAYRNRARMVQRLLELKHAEEKKLGVNKSLGAQCSCQTPPTYDKLLGVNSHITNNDKGGLN